MNRKEDCWYKHVCTYDSCINCIRYSEMKYLIQNSGLPKNRQKPQELSAGCDYKEFVRLSKLKDDILDFVESGDSLYICSKETGNGKTSWAIKLLLKYFDSIWAGNGFKVRGYFVHVPTLLTVLKDFSKSHDDLKRILDTADIVIWDDIAATKLSEYDVSQLLIFIDSRIVNGQANIYTGNIVTKDALEKSMGTRLASRIWNTSLIVEFKGKDRRHESGNDF